MGRLSAVMAVLLQLIARVGVEDTGRYDFCGFSELAQQGASWSFIFFSGQCPM